MEPLCHAALSCIKYRAISARGKMRTMRYITRWSRKWQKECGLCAALTRRELHRRLSDE
ncbi:hypothetical protein KCP71_03500 [Salmonella enterica subsp. enterica]|nr:hypothetical protein KCP71_03500 [Salmonella enterica subsp. enterica]